MTATGPVRLVIRRELAERVRQRSFAISTGVTLLIILAIAILPGVLRSDGPTEYDIGLVGPATEPLGEALTRVGASQDLEVTTRPLSGRAEAERLVGQGDLDAAVDGGSVIVDEELDGELETLLQLANRDALAQRALAQAGLSGPQAQAISTPPPLRTEALNPPDRAQDDRRALTTFGVFFLFGQLFGYGYAVASSVVEEKSSRVVELLLAKMRPGQLLAGKIIGVGVLGLAQLVLYLVVGLVAADVSGSIDPPPGLVGAAALVLGWFVLGFALYSALFAMAGAVASRVEELQNTTTPITFLIMGGYVAAIVAAGDPGSAAARVSSFVPPFAPLVMPIRVAADEAAPWELAVAVALVAVTAYGVVRAAARVYAGGALRTRGRLKLRDAWTARPRAG